TPTMLFALVELSGFRWAWRQLAIGLVFGLGTIILIFFRNTPEESGLLLDGIGPHPTGQLGTKRAEGLEATRSQAIRDQRFWIVTLPIFSLSVVGTALTFHIVDLGHEVGLDESTIVLIFVPVALISIPITLVSGWLADTVPVIALAVLMAAIQMIMYLTVGELDHPVLRIVAIASWGASSGLQAALMAAALPRLFGRTHLGAIAGAQMSALVIGSALGPFFFAWVQQVAGSYQRALVFSLVGPIASLALAAHYAATRRRRELPIAG
ncbi:MAG: MFS transporter, partial [Actinomycetia bacterium]|nr:MFS transporter [Actinomycetes bacterium]